MEPFEGSPHTYVSDSQELPHLRNDFRSLEKLKNELTHEKEYLQIQSEDLQHKIKQFVMQKEAFDKNCKKQRDALRRKEFEFAKKEAEFYQLYENFCTEKEKWSLALDTQLGDIENRELELEAQREELASELEKCQILGESLHKIQSDIKSKSVVVNDREQGLKRKEERILMQVEDLAGKELRILDKEKDFKEFEENILRIVQDIESRQEDIAKTSDMFERINKNLLDREKKLQKGFCAVNRDRKIVEKEKALNYKKAEDLKKWEKEIESKLISLRLLEESLHSKTKVLEKYEFHKDVPSVTTEEDEECCVIGFNVLTPRSTESNI